MIETTKILFNKTDIQEYFSLFIDDPLSRVQVYLEELFSVFLLIVISYATPLCIFQEAPEQTIHSLGDINRKTHSNIIMARRFWYVIFSIARAFIAMPEAKKEIVRLICKEVTSVTVGLCWTLNPSVLRELCPDKPMNYTCRWKLFTMIEHVFKVSRSSSQILPEEWMFSRQKRLLQFPCYLLDARCQLIAIFNVNMYATRKLKSVVPKKTTVSQYNIFKLAKLLLINQKLVLTA